MACGGCNQPCSGCAGKAKRAASRVVSGVVGLSKVAMQAVGIPVDQADAQTVQQRRDVCRECPHASKSDAARFTSFSGLTSRSTCDQCGCFIKAKTMIASEVCPKGKWPT